MMPIELDLKHRFPPAAAWTRRVVASTALALVLVLSLALVAVTQPADPPPFGPGGPPPGDGPPGFGGPPMGFPGGGGPGGMMRGETKLVARFDTNGDGRLNREERQAARAALTNETSSRFQRRGPGGPGRGEDSTPPQPGRPLSPADVPEYPDRSLYDPLTLRTLFLEFENSDWEKELADFHNTDVEVPARLTVDGTTYPDVGVHFRGMSSYMMVSAGYKRSLNLALDFVREGQNVGGYRTLNLLNAHEDPSFLRTALYSEIARDYLPTPKANWVRLVINGECWGIYINLQQFNKDFIKESYGSPKGPRWKVPGSPNGRAGLEYLGDDPAPYRRLYEIKSKDDSESWGQLIRLCKVLNETAPEALEAALTPLLDIDETLKFLALENTLINNDGYWIRASDYSLYLDTRGKFHTLPGDFNEVFSAAGGPGFGGGPGRGRRDRGPGGGPGGFGRGGGMTLDPLVAANDDSKPLLSRLLAVPVLRERYLGYVRQIAGKWLDWERLGPLALKYHKLLADEVRQDTRKLDSTEAFLQSVDGGASPSAAGGFPGRRPTVSLKTFAEARRSFLLAPPSAGAAPNTTPGAGAATPAKDP